MKRLFLGFSVLLTVFISGCVHTPTKEVPPAISTAAIKSSLQDTQSKLDDAGKSNTKVASHVDRAIDLADQLKDLLDQIDKEQQTAVKK